jgi:hypothetical protein
VFGPLSKNQTIPAFVNCHEHVGTDLFGSLVVFDDTSENVLDSESLWFWNRVLGAMNHELEPGEGGLRRSLPRSGDE